MIKDVVWKSEDISTRDFVYTMPFVGGIYDGRVAFVKDYTGIRTRVDNLEQEYHVVKVKRIDGRASFIAIPSKEAEVVEDE
jgi:hypothetical protein